MRIVFHISLLALYLLGGPMGHHFAQTRPEKPAAASWITANESELKRVNQKIWTLAELGLEEHESARTLIEFLEANGFTVKRGVAGMPTAFVATYGTGKPVVGVLAEYDALPGLSQTTSAQRESREGSANGHACGHSVFGTASVGAAIAVRHAMEQSGMKGTIRLYGTPAEETVIGKVYMVREGLFDDCDAVFHWHASDRSASWYESSKAAVSVKFTFHGLAAHASVSPQDGKSALDAVELMNIGANYMREHLSEDARIHYVITNGGGQPNVVPPEAQVWYYLRADRHRDVEAMLQRVVDIAKGAALMTGTTMDWRVDTDALELLPNYPLSQVIHRNLELVGPPRFTDTEKEFARRTQQSLTRAMERPLSETIEPLPEEPGRSKGSTDVGNISWIIPTGGLQVASYTYGAPGHSWQIVACTGMSIGEKGMLVATRTLAFSAIDLFIEPEWLERAKADFERRKAGAEFTSLLPKGQKPPERIR